MHLSGRLTLILALALALTLAAEEPPFTAIVHLSGKLTLALAPGLTLAVAPRLTLALAPALILALTLTLTLYIANVHLSGGAAPERRMRQVHGVTERVRKWQAAEKQAAAKAAKGRRGKADAARQAQERP